MKIVRKFTLENNSATHAPWGKKHAVKGVVREQAVEFILTREDFKDPADWDAAFSDIKELTCYAIASSISSRWGFEVNNRWIFIATPEQEEAIRQLWIKAQGESFKDSTLSQAYCQQWMSYIMINGVKSESLPNA